MTTRSDHGICFAMAFLAAAAPLPFGSAGVMARSAVQVAVLALSLWWVVLRRSRRLPVLPWRDPLLLGGAALACFGLLQIVPMPAGLVEVVSPSAATLRATYAPGPSSWMPLSIDPYATWNATLRIISLTLAALLVRHNAVERRGRLIVAWGLLAGGLFQAGYGLFEFISGRQHIFGFQKVHFTDVATGTFINRNHLASYLEMIIPVALGLAILCLPRAARGAGVAGESMGPMALIKRRLAMAGGPESFRALLLLMGAFLMAVALLMSRSRMGIVSMLFALVVGGLALGLRGRSRGFAIASVGVAAVAIVFASQIDILPVVKRFHQVRDEFGVGYSRLDVWKQSGALLADYPVAGSGLGTWEAAFSPFRDDTAQLRVDYAHNDYLEFVAETGAAGLLILGIATFAVLQSSGRGRRDELAVAAGCGLLALALHSLTDFHLSIPADALAAACLAGLFLRAPGPMDAGGESHVTRAGEVRFSERPLPLRRRLAVALCTGLLVFLMVAAVTPAVADRLATTTLTDGDARTSSARGGAAGAPGDKESTLMAADGAPSDVHLAAASGPRFGEGCGPCRIEPFAATRWIESASVLRQRLMKDVEALVVSQERGGMVDPQSRLYLARRLDEARAMATRGMALSPGLAQGHMEAGLLLFGRFALTGLPPEASDDFALAVTAFERTLAREPWRASAHTQVARVLGPLLDQAGPIERTFIEQTLRRAHELDPLATDISANAASRGL